MNQPDLQFVKDLALGAGDILRSFIGKDKDIHHKGITDLVTAADHAAEKFIIDAIRQNYPQHAIYAEESGKLSGNANLQWYIDPLDGTVNFAHGVPIFSVSIAFAINGQVQLGVIYDPVQQECFFAERGKGAYLNDAALHVSETAQLIDCLLVTGFPYNLMKTERNNLNNFAHFSLISQGVRRLGSAALDLCYVAAGRLDGFWEQSIKPWDIAAGALIVEEAGGRVTKMLGDEAYLPEPCSILAANPVIHALMLAELQQKNTA